MNELEKFVKLTEEKLKVAENYLPHLVFPNYSKKDKRVIIDALLFWEELRNQRLHGFDDLSTDTIIERLFELKIAKNNPLIKTIIMIEFLPTSAWRTLLWQENIDFMSYEAFLRRLSDEQKNAIEENFKDWQKKLVPRVFKKGLRNQLKVKLGIISYKKLKNEPYDYNKRYTSKAAWAYNLLGLDFGFCLYPKGEASDQKIVNKSFTRFLSIKEHISDFVVNEENGKYWSMYKTARSNYAIRPNKEVEINTHICPGFWFTLIIHTLFWIVSPIALVSTGLSVWQFGLSWESLSPAIFALPMLVWTLFAIIRLIRDLFVNLFRLLRSINDHWLTKLSKKIAVGFLSTVIFLWILLLIYYFFIVVVPIYYSLVLPIMGPLLATLVLFSILYYLFFLLGTIYFHEKKVYKFMLKTKWLIYLTMIPLIAGAIGLIDAFLSHHVIALFVFLAESIWFWFTTDALINTWLIIAGTFFASQIYFINIKDEEKFVRQSKLMMFLINAFIIITTGFFFALWLREGFLTLGVIGHITVFILALIIISTAIHLIINSEINKKTINKRKAAHNFLANLFGKYNKKLFKGLLNNQISQDYALLDNIAQLANRLFMEDSELKKEFIFLILNLPDKKIRKIIDHQVHLFNLKEESIDIFIKGKYRSNLLYLYFVINHLIKDGYSLKKAKLKTDEEIEKINKAYSKRIKEKNERRIIITQKIDKILSPFVWLFRKIYRFFATLNYLWVYFNKICPYKMKTKVLY